MRVGIDSNAFTAIQNTYHISYHICFVFSVQHTKSDSCDVSNICIIDLRDGVLRLCSYLLSSSVYVTLELNTFLYP